MEHKIILACTKQGILKQIFLDTGCLLENIQLPISLHSLVSEGSLMDLGNFWIAINDKSMEENTTLTLTYDEKHLDFIFSGYLLDKTVLLCGNTELSATEKVLEGIMAINNEQANQIRLNEKKVHSIPTLVDKREINESFLNDFTSLNNELINNKRELTQKNQKIELLNKKLNSANENMSLFTYSVSHDLKEPVRMMKSFLTLLHKKYGDSLDEKGQTYMDFALDGANRLSKMMADLLVYHQSSNFETSEKVDLNNVLLEVKYVLQQEIELKKAQITYKNFPILIGSSTGFLQIFQNLISNAIKFVTEGKSPIISIKLEENDFFYTFMVSDNGIGIAKKHNREAFHPFKRLNSPQQYDGTGMGLAIVRKSVEKMGGEVWLESEINNGTTVYFTIKKSLESFDNIKDT